MTSRGPTPDEWKNMTKAQRTAYTIFMAVVIVILGGLLLVKLWQVFNGH